jgi:hypothetical protein
VLALRRKTARMPESLILLNACRVCCSHDAPMGSGMCSNRLTFKLTSLPRFTNSSAKTSPLSCQTAKYSRGCSIRTTPCASPSGFNAIPTTVLLMRGLVRSISGKYTSMIMSSAESRLCKSAVMSSTKAPSIAQGLSSPSAALQSLRMDSSLSYLASTNSGSGIYTLQSLSSASSGTTTGFLSLKCSIASNKAAAKLNAT